MIYSALRSPVRPSVQAAHDRILEALKLGPELLVNGDFENGAAGWSIEGTDANHVLTFANGVVRFQSTTTSPVLQLSQNILTVGKQYLMTLLVPAWTSGSVKTDALGSTGVGAISGVAPHSRRGTAIQTGFNLTRASSGVDITLDKVSVREILP